MRINKRTNTALAGTLLTSLALTACSGGSEDGARSAGEQGSGGQGGGDLVWATSSQGSDIYVSSVEMAELMSQNSDANVTVQSVGGSEASLRAIADGHADISLVNSLALINAYQGEAPFEQAVDVRLHLQGYLSERQLIVRADSGITSPADLAGKRCACERPALSELRMITDAVLQAWEVDPASVEIVVTNETNEAINALRQGSVDAVMLPGSAGAGPFLELAQSSDVEWIDLSERQDELLDILGPAFSPSTIPADTYEGQDEDIATVALRQVTAVAADVPEETVSAITAAVLENVDSMSTPNADAWSVDTSTANTIPIPYHDGVVAYFEETGVWTEELEQAQQDATG